MEKTSYCATVSQSVNPLATRGMVTSPNYLATQAGLDVLRRGGNAVDAAIATAITLAVVYPQMCTPGGDNFWLIYNAKTGELKGLNASGRAVEALSMSGTITDSELYGVRKVLKAAAMTYVATLAVSVAQLLRLMLIFGGRDRD